VTESVVLPASLKGSIMPVAFSLPHQVNVRIQRPRLPRVPCLHDACSHYACANGFDLRTFECPKCDRVQELMVATEAFGGNDHGVTVTVHSIDFSA